MNVPKPPKKTFSRAQKIKKIAAAFETILQALGIDLTNPSVRDTPLRIAKMYVEELFRGLTQAFPRITTVKDDFYQKRQGMILVRNITLHSTCEHHFVPMVGVVHIAYLSNGEVLGLSKLNRIVDFYARRPQLQERLTTEIAEKIASLLNTEHVAVLVQAQHFCVMTRGVQDRSSDTITHYFLGRFQDDPELHREFLESALHHPQPHL
jgi:GTP cyclohydrolase I